jgi:hypothetical protein
VVGAVCFLAGATLLAIGLILSHKGKLPARMQVSWATAAPAETAATAADANAPHAETASDEDEPTEDEGKS